MSQMRQATLFPTLMLVFMLMLGGPCFGAEKYPTMPIQLIVPFVAGGATDVLARGVEKTWAKYSPQPMIVVNKPGAGGVLGEEYVIRSKPDGYTLYFGQGSGHDLVMPHLQKMPYDPFKDLTPVAMLALDEFVLWVNADKPYKNVKDYIDAVKAAPAGSMKMGGTGSKQEDQIITVAVEKAIGAKFTYIPYKGGGEVAARRRDFREREVTR